MRVEVAVAEALGREGGADDDRRGALDSGRLDLGRDRCQRSAKDQLVGTAGEGDDRRWAVGAVVRGERFGDRVDRLGAEVYHKRHLYTSDAGDDLLCVDLGGRRISKKKENSLHY